MNAFAFFDLFFEIFQIGDFCHFVVKHERLALNIHKKGNIYDTIFFKKSSGNIAGTGEAEKSARLRVTI